MDPAEGDLAFSCQLAGIIGPLRRERGKAYLVIEGLRERESREKSRVRRKINVVQSDLR